MELGELKPLLGTLVLLPASPLLLAGLGLLWVRRRKLAGGAVVASRLERPLPFRSVAGLIAPSDPTESLSGHLQVGIL